MPDKYIARIYGASWRSGPAATFSTIRAARAWAESYGTTADGCLIQRVPGPRSLGRTVALHQRDTAGDGTRWFRACV
jgi:hypothetical protein